MMRGYFKEDISLIDHWLRNYIGHKTKIPCKACCEAAKRF